MLTHFLVLMKYKTDLEDMPFSILGHYSGYWQLPVDPSDWAKTAFCPVPGLVLLILHNALWPVRSSCFISLFPYLSIQMQPSAGHLGPEKTATRIRHVGILGMYAS